MSHLEYCACGHPHDHCGKPCGHESIDSGAAKCGCDFGIRVDLATFRVLADQTAIADQQRMLMAEQCQTLARILAVLEESSGLKSRLVDAGNGRARVEVKPKIVVVGG